MSEVRAHIEHSIMVDGVAIYLAVGPFGQKRRIRITTNGIEYDAPAGPVTVDPSLSLPDDIARALLDALLDHYGHATGGRLQRADFEHERKRRDLLEDAMVAIIKDAASG